MEKNRQTNKQTKNTIIKQAKNQPKKNQINNKEYGYWK